MKENQLPKYFVVKQDLDNPLCNKYIDWLNKTYGVNWTGGAQGCYYGFDGGSEFEGTNCYASPNCFQNSPTLLTLEQWDAIVNPKELKVGDKVELHGFEYVVEKGVIGRYYLSCIGDLNSQIFIKLGVDNVSEFTKKVLGYHLGGDFPYCKTLSDLTKLVNALKNYKQPDTAMTEKTYEVTREQMGKIRAIVFESWKTIVDGLVDKYFGKYDAKANLPHSEVKEMMAAATDKQKPVLKEIFPTYSEQVVIPKGEWAWVKEYNDLGWVCRCSDGYGEFYCDQKTSGDTRKWKFVVPYNQRPF